MQRYCISMLTMEIQRRQTKTKQAVQQVFDAAQGPLSLSELVAAVHEMGLKSDRSTVYRELMRLKADGLLSEMSLHGATHYERVAAGEHHHHAICENCESVIELDIEDIIASMEASLAKLGFATKKHIVDFIGHCSSCKTV